jgi:hypothetical protein
MSFKACLPVSPLKGDLLKKALITVGNIHHQNGTKTSSFCHTMRTTKCHTAL